MCAFRHAHPGSPYVFGLVEDNHDLDFPDPMPVVGKSQLDLVKDLLLMHVDEFSFWLNPYSHYFWRITYHSKMN